MKDGQLNWNHWKLCLQKQNLIEEEPLETDE